MTQWYQWRRPVCAVVTHLVVSARVVECNVYSESGGVVVRPEKRLLVGLISNYERQIKLSLQRNTTTEDQREAHGSCNALKRDKQTNKQTNKQGPHPRPTP